MKNIIFSSTVLLIAILLIAATAAASQNGPIDADYDFSLDSEFVRRGLAAAHSGSVTRSPAARFSVNPNAAIQESTLNAMSQTKSFEIFSENLATPASSSLLLQDGDEEHAQGLHDYVRSVARDQLGVDVAPTAAQQQGSRPNASIGYPECVYGSATLQSGNLPLIWYGRGADLGHYSECMNVPDYEWCSLNIAMMCVGINNKTFNIWNASTWINSIEMKKYPYPLFCNGGYYNQAVGVCKNKTNCDDNTFADGLFNYSVCTNKTNCTSKAFVDDLFLNHSDFYDRYIQQKLGIFPVCYGLDAAYRFKAKEIPGCDPLLSFIYLEPWCDTRRVAAAAAAEAGDESATTKAVAVGLLVLLSFSAFCSFVGGLRRTYLSVKKSFGDEGDDSKFRAGGLYAHESLDSIAGVRGSNKLGFLDKFLIGTAMADDDGYSSIAAKRQQEEQQPAQRASLRDDDEADLYVMTTQGDGRGGSSGGAYSPANTAAAGARAPLLAGSGGGGNDGGEACGSCCPEGCCDSFLDRLPAQLAGFCDAFDIYSGLLDFFTPEKHPISTGWLDGFRVCAMSLVVCGHVLYFINAYSGYSNKYSSILDFAESYRSITLLPALLAVDTFFYLSGFLGSLLLLKTLRRLRSRATSNGSDGDGVFVKKQLPVIFMSYILRWIRLVVPIMFVITLLTWWLPSGNLVAGPLSRILHQDAQIGECKKYLGWTALFVQNLHLSPDRDWIGCVSWFWYLACDMQCFLFVPVIVMLHHYFEDVRATGGFIARNFALIVLGTATVFLYGWAIYRHPITNPFINDKGEPQFGYIKASDKATPYALGAFFAFLCSNEDLIAKMRNKPAITWVLNFFAFAMFIAIWNTTWKLGVIFHTDRPALTDAWQYGGHAAYMLWGVPLGLLSLTAATTVGGEKKGNAFLFQRFFGHSVFSVLGKLTLGQYLWHPILIELYVAQAWTWRSFSSSYQYYVFCCAFLMLSGLVSLSMWLVVERPTAKLINKIGSLVGKPKSSALKK